MTTYTVTATNKFFWQTLIVAAQSPEEACHLFSAYLGADANKRDEDYEYGEQVKIAGSSLDSEYFPAPVRADYSYDFTIDEIEEDSTRDGNGAVRSIDSGGNG